MGKRIENKYRGEKKYKTTRTYRLMRDKLY